MSLYQRWVHKRELALTLRDQNRRILPFSWGLEWFADCPHHSSQLTAHRSPLPELQSENCSPDPLTRIKRYAQEALCQSDAFFSPPPLQGAQLQGDMLTFVTPTACASAENNTVYCRLFVAPGSDRAAIVIPQWNAPSSSHVGLCWILRRLGITAVRLCMPYHEQRRPQGMQRADYMLSPNVGRTLHATRQAVLEVRQLACWLREQGYRKIAVVGTSIGSCVGYLAFVHDPSIGAGVFNHVSSFFADVVWTGLSTRYVRWGLEGHIGLEDLRQCWAPISPWFFIPRLKADNRPHLMITARYDLTFRPELAEKVFQHYQAHGISCRRVVLPCGHYTTASFPFKYLDGWHICRFLSRHLPGL